MEKFAVAWLFMWGMSYILTGLLAPSIAGDVLTGIILYWALGFAIMGSLILLYCEKVEEEEFPDEKYQTKIVHPYVNTARCILCVLGIISTYGGVASWTGLVIWNIPFENLELFQISMAFADLISAVFMFLLALSPPHEQ